MQAKWQNKRKPAAVESNETTESMEVGEGEGAVAEGGLEGGGKARVLWQKVGWKEGGRRGCRGRRWVGRRGEGQGWDGWVGRGTGGCVIGGRGTGGGVIGEGAQGNVW